MAIRSYANGTFDGKVNANKFAVLLKAMMGTAQTAQMQQWAPLMAPAEKLAKKKETKPAKPAKDPAKVLSPHILRELGIKIKGLPMKNLPSRKAPAIVKEKGKAVIKECR